MFAPFLWNRQGNDLLKELTPKMPTFNHRSLYIINFKKRKKKVEQLERRKAGKGIENLGNYKSTTDMPINDQFSLSNTLADEKL